MGIPYEQTAEYAQKQAILDERAARFKAEAGFEGDLTYSHHDMKFLRYYGQFTSIQFPSTKDSTSYKQAFNSVLERILPYISARRTELVEADFRLSQWNNSITYRQMVNGYPIESGGRLVISYKLAQKRIVILDETVAIPFAHFGDIISQEDAFNIAWDHFVTTDLFSEKTPKSRSKTSIVYRNRILNGNPQPYKLYWKVAFPGILYYVNAYTSEFYTEGYVVNQEYTYSIKGNKYNKDTTFSLLESQPVVGVQVVNGDFQDYTNSNGIVLFPIPLDQSYQVILWGERFNIRSYRNLETLSVSNRDIVDSLYIVTCIADTIAINDSTFSCYAPNVIHHIADQDVVFKNHENQFSTVE